MHMKTNEPKHLWQLKKNDSVFILDMGDIDSGFQEYKVLKNKHHKETCFSCGCEETNEYWTLEFESPYLNRYVNVYKEHGCNANLTFTYAWKENGYAKTKQVYLVITSDIPHGIEKVKYELETGIKARKHNIASKTTAIEKMIIEIEFDKGEVVRLENMLKKFEQ